MFVMSSLDFTHYLNKLDAAHAPQFPLPGDLPFTHRQGDFDVIILHRQYGVLLGEIKSVGLYDNNPTDKTVADKVTKAVKQLHKCEEVVNHVMSDVAPGVSVRKTLILPYISRARLQQVLNGDSQLAQECRPGLTETGANTNPTGGATTTSPPPLQYRDVLVVTRSDKLNEERRDVRGDLKPQAFAMVCSKTKANKLSSDPVLDF
nr:hypothetical protein BaRGS_008087 [Batillaria attramentaria]